MLLLALVMGVGLFSTISGTLGWFVERQPGISPFPAFLLVTVGSLLLLLVFRRRLQRLAEPAPVRRRGAGALMGLLRGLIVVLVLVGLGPSLPFQSLRDALGPDSLCGRLGTPIAETAQWLASRIGTR